MSEIVTYTTPQYHTPAATSVKMLGLQMFIEPTPLFIGLLRETNGTVIRDFEIRYTAEEGALALMLALNKANLSTKSLLRRAMERFIADGKLASGAISGLSD